MLRTLRGAGLVWPSLLALPALALLIGLGVWQMQRKAWKDGLAAQIQARMTAGPVALDEVMQRMTATLDDRKANMSAWSSVEYTRVRAIGRFIHHSEQYLYAPDARLGPGVNVYAPLSVVGSGCATVIVNRGFVAEPLKAPAARPAGQIAPQSGQAMAEVVGLVRLAEQPGAFTPANDQGKNLWFWRDLDGMAVAMGLRGGKCTYPFFIDAAAEPANPGGWPKGGTTILNLPNRHLEYALTWFGLAATLVGVFGVFAAGRLRTQSGPGPG